MVTAQQIKERIIAQLECTYIQVEAYEGQDHFRAVVVSPAFAGISRLQQHRLVFEPLKGDMHAAIHALQLDTWAPVEWEDKKNRMTKEQL